MTRSSSAPAERRYRRARLMTLALALCAPALLAGRIQAAPVAPSESAAITVISMEKDCFGCSRGERWVLRRDGLVSFTVTGKARHQTQDEISVGAVSSEDFEALARLTLGQGFFAMQDVYEDPQTRDGTWVQMTVELKDGASKQVFRRDAQGPAELKLIEAALQDLLGRITLKRKHP